MGIAGLIIYVVCGAIICVVLMCVYGAKKYDIKVMGRSGRE